MDRVSTNQSNNDMQYHMRLRQKKLNNIQNRIASQNKIQDLRDDPVAASNSVRYKSQITRLKKFSKNIETVQSNYRIAEGYIKESVNILHRVRELAIQGANSTFSDDERKYMGEEVNQLLNEMVELSRARIDGKMIFSGDKLFTEPFKVLKGHVDGGDGEKITNVLYNGSVKENKVEVAESSFINNNFMGNKIFWAEHQQVISNKNAEDFYVDKDTSIFIDGNKIALNRGDNIHALVGKINSSSAAVKAYLDPVNNSLSLTTTSPHQLWVEDAFDGDVMKKLGVLSGKSIAPYNFSENSMVSGGSTFDMLINLRNNLFNGNVIDIGSSSIKGIDLSLNNMLAQVAEIGAQDNRLEITYGRLSEEIPKLIDRDSKETDIDMAEAITELKMMEYANKASLQTAARILQPTLLDYLR